MDRVCVDVGGVSTEVSIWGGNPQEKFLCRDETVVIFVPGIPGVIKFYEPFLERLHGRLRCPVLGLGHLGHEAPTAGRKCKVPPLKGNEKMYGLVGQCDHKVGLVRGLVPKDAKIYLVGHSIGAQVALKMLEAADVRSRVEKCYLLFPVLENMPTSSMGRTLNCYVRPLVRLILIAAALLSLLPRFLLLFFWWIYATVDRVSKSQVKAMAGLVDPGSLEKIYHMTFDAMDLLGEPDLRLISENVDRIRLLYTRGDYWVPDFCLERLMREVPGVDAVLPDKVFDHSFVLKSRETEEIAEMVASWIENDLLRK